MMMKNTNEVTIEELKEQKVAMEKEIKTLIEHFIYETNTVPKNMKISISTVKSATKAVVFTDSIKVTFDLEI